MIASNPRGTRVPATFCYVVAALLLVILPASPTQARAQQATALMEVSSVRSARSVSFRDRQLRFPRVRTAWESRGQTVASLFEEKGLTGPVEVFFRVFKREQVLEVWARERGTHQFVLVKDYPICALSGRLGPKRREGDGQIPEGFYSIDLLNPWSKFHLSMRVDYPNAVDRFRGSRGKLGGDIYIHGGCATIGCVPVTDRWIEELYVIAVRARDDGQREIPTHIFPTRLNDAGVRWLARTYGRDFVDFPFWENLQQGYIAFERTHTLPAVGHERGEYTVVGTPVPEVVTSIKRGRGLFGIATS